MQHNIITTVKVRGSGSNAQLLTGHLQDVHNAVTLDVRQYQFVKILMSGLFAVAVSLNNHLLVWGNINNEFVHIPRQLSNLIVVELSCGWQHCLILTDTRKVYGFGNNKFSQISNQKNAYIKDPKLMIDHKTELICAGFRQSYIKTNGLLLGRGENKNCELTNRKCQGEWTLMAQLPAKKLVAGKRFFLALDINHNLWGCGCNQYQVFDRQEQQLPELTKIYEKVQDVTAGWNHIVVKTLQMNVITKGRNNLGQLGIKQANNIDIQNVHKIVSGTQFNFLIQETKKVYAWGWNQHSNICDNKQMSILQPQLVQEAEGCEDIITYGAATIFTYI